MPDRAAAPPPVSLGEFEMIKSLFAPMAGEGGLSLEDDAAVLRPSPGADLVLTKDALVEGVHFFADDPPESIARKLLRVNVSDLIAKGARPRGFLLALARGPRHDQEWLARFAAALGEDARHYGIELLGGDTVKAAQGMFSLTAIGEVPKGRMVRRQGGAPGDRLYVTGTIGDAALGLALRTSPAPGWAAALLPEHRAFLLDRYLHPQPKAALAPLVCARASAAMDISDGLVGDAEKLALCLGRTVFIEKIPLSEAANAILAQTPDLLETVLTGGDDYEILMAVPPAESTAFEAEALRLGVPVANIGHLGAVDAPHVWQDASGQPLSFARKSYAHF
jgi:thiamine-monophosphate kinase